MKIVVTGGAGFIGGNFVYYMLKKRQEDTIICLDKLTYVGNMENMAEAMKNDQFKFVCEYSTASEPVNLLVRATRYVTRSHC